MLVPASGLLGIVGLNASGIAKDLLDKAGETLFDKRGKEILRQLQLSLRAQTGATPTIPLNHDLEYAIDSSALTAALVLLGHYRSEKELEHLETRGAQLAPFVSKAWDWLIQQIRSCQSSSTKANGLILADIQSAIDQVLPETQATAMDEGLAAARNQIWASLIEAAGPAPPDFEALFAGQTAGEPGWSVQFIALFREALKTNPRAEIAFVTSRLSGLRAALRGIAEEFNSITNITTATQRDVAELLVIARQNQAALEAAQKGTPKIAPVPAIKYFDTQTRDLMRSKLSIYRDDHRIKLAELVNRIAEHLGLSAEILYKNTKRFMDGKIRIDDSFVGLIAKFTDTLPVPSVPCPAWSIPDGFRIELAINDRGEAIVFHNMPIFLGGINWLEFDLTTGRLGIVQHSRLFIEFLIPVRPELNGYIKRADRALFVLLDKVTHEPIEGGYIPLLIFGD